MNILLQKISEQQSAVSSQVSIQTQPKQQYSDFPDDPVQIYAELCKLVQIQDIQYDEKKIQFEKAYTEDFIITETDARSVYIMGIPRQATATDVDQRFQQIGKIRKVSQGGKNWYVEFEDPSSVAVAIERMSGQLMLGSKMTVQQKKTVVQKRK